VSKRFRRQSIHAGDPVVSLHGVVFDILIGSENRFELAAVFPDDHGGGGLPSRSSGDHD